MFIPIVLVCSQPSSEKLLFCSGQQSVQKLIIVQYAENERLSECSALNRTSRSTPILLPLCSGNIVEEEAEESQSWRMERSAVNAAFWAWRGVATMLPKPQQLQLPAQDLCKNRPSEIPAQVGQMISRPHPLLRSYLQLTVAN